jgi:hypothetical protein
MPDLRANLAVLDDHFKTALAAVDGESLKLSNLDAAVGNILQLVNLLIEDYGNSWDLFEVARTRINELEAQIAEGVKQIIRPHLVVPGRE